MPESSRIGESNKASVQKLTQICNLRRIYGNGPYYLPMSAVQPSDDLVEKVQQRTGQDDFEQGVWQLIYKSRGRQELDV